MVPVFAEIFEEFEGITRTHQFLVNAGDFVLYKWWLMLSVICWIIIAISLMTKSKQAKYVFDRAILRVPLVGDLIVKVSVARFASHAGYPDHLRRSHPAGPENHPRDHLQ